MLLHYSLIVHLTGDIYGAIHFLTSRRIFAILRSELTHDRERGKFTPKHIPRSPLTLRNNNAKRSLGARAVYWSLMFYEYAVRTAASIQL